MCPGLGLSPKFYYFFTASLLRRYENGERKEGKLLEKYLIEKQIYGRVKIKEEICSTT